MFKVTGKMSLPKHTDVDRARFDASLALLEQLATVNGTVVRGRDGVRKCTFEIEAA